MMQHVLIFHKFLQKNLQLLLKKGFRGRHGMTSDKEISSVATTVRLWINRLPPWPPRHDFGLSNYLRGHHGETSD